MKGRGVMLLKDIDIVTDKRRTEWDCFCDKYNILSNQMILAGLDIELLKDVVNSLKYFFENNVLTSNDKIE